jgi:hypothetical protein
MATVQGGIIDSAVISAVSKDLISSLLTQLAIVEGNLTQVTESGTTATRFDAPVVTTAGGSLNSSIIATNGDSANVTQDGGYGYVLTVDTNPTGTGNVVIEVKSSTAPATATAVTQQGTVIAGGKVADTPTGQAVQNINSALIADLVGTSANAWVSSLDFKGGNGTDVVQVTAVAPTVVGGIAVTALTLGNGVSANFTGDLDSTNPILVNTTAGVRSTIDFSQTTGDVNLSLGIGTVSIVSGGGDDRIVIGSGSATISGGAGADSIIGGSGGGGVGGGTLVNGLQAVTNSTPYLAFEMVINGFDRTEDKIGFNYAGVDSWEDFIALLATAKMVGSDTVATTRLGDKITITGVDISTLTQDLFFFS